MPTAPQPRPSLSGASDQVFIGKPRSWVVLNYGLPDQTTRTGKNMTRMEYHNRTAVDESGENAKSCKLRLWYAEGASDPVIIRTDLHGSRKVCSAYIASRLQKQAAE